MKPIAMETVKLLEILEGVTEMFLFLLAAYEQFLLLNLLAAGIGCLFRIADLLQ